MRIFRVIADLQVPDLQDDSTTDEQVVKMLHDDPDVRADLRIKSVQKLEVIE